MAQSITRRRLLTTGVGLLTIGLGLSGGRTLMTDVEDVVAHIIKNHVGKSNLKTGAAERFARDYAPLTSASPMFRASVATNLYFHPKFRAMLAPDRLALVEAYDRKVITDFLVSSDFEPSGKAAIDYIGLYLDHQCNLYARFVDL